MRRERPDAPGDDWSGPDAYSWQRAKPRRPLDSATPASDIPALVERLRDWYDSDGGSDFLTAADALEALHAENLRLIDESNRLRAALVQHHTLFIDDGEDTLTGRLGSLAICEGCAWTAEARTTDEAHALHASHVSEEVARALRGTP